MEIETLVIRHARIIDPSCNLDQVGDVLIGSGEILATGSLGLEVVFGLVVSDVIFHAES